MKNKIKTVTVGISTHNEETTIIPLLNSLVTQNTSNYVLKTIFVALDGCNTKTKKLVTKFAAKHSIVRIIDDGQRVGKAGRLNQIYELNTSDIIVIFDADVVLSDNHVIAKLVEKFNDKNVGLVGGYAIPMQPRNYFESIICTWLSMWNEIRVKINNGDTIHNNLGCVTALSRELAKCVRLPNAIIPDDDYTYITAHKNKFKFRFAEDAIVYYRTVSNFSDFLIQHSRLIFSKRLVIEHFGKSARNYYKTPKALKNKVLVKSFLKSPVKTALAILMQAIIRFGRFLPQETYSNGHWQVALSSKK